MSDDPSIRERIEKLPVWVQEHIKQLVSQREAAITALNRMVDNDTPAPFYFEEGPCIGEGRGGPSPKRRYIQSDWIRFNFNGLLATFLLRRLHKDECVLDIQYGADDRLVGNKIVLEPRSYQQLYIYCPRNMEKTT